VFGIIGGLLAQGVYGHKTAKSGYVLITGVIAAGHAALLVAAGLGVPSPESLVNLAIHMLESRDPGP